MTPEELLKPPSSKLTPKQQDLLSRIPKEFIERLGLEPIESEEMKKNKALERTITGILQEAADTKWEPREIIHLPPPMSNAEFIVWITTRQYPPVIINGEIQVPF